MSINPIEVIQCQMITVAHKLIKLCYECRFPPANVACCIFAYHLIFSLYLMLDVICQHSYAVSLNVVSDETVHVISCVW